MNRFLHLLTALLLLPGWLLAQAVQPGTNISATVQIHAGGGKMAEYGSLTFNSGYVITPRSSPADNLSFRPGSSYAGANNTSHVNGYAEVISPSGGGGAFTFPIGNGTTLRPAGISAPTTSGTFQAAYFSTNPSSGTLPTGGPFPTTSLGTGVSAVSTAEYWDVNGPSAVNLTLHWNAGSGLGTLVGSTLADLIMVGWDGTKWVNLGGTATGTLTGNGTITTTTPVTPDTYTAYTFGKAGSVTPPGSGTACGIVIHGPTNVEVHPNGHMVVYCDVTFIDGYVNTPRPTPNDNIVFMPGTTYFDASDDSHVNGYTEKVGNTAFVFPVGNGTMLRPVGMSAPASGTSTLQAAYFSTNPASATLPTGAPFATTSRGTGVSTVSPVEYWDVNGSEPVELTFTWNAASNLNALTNSTLSDLIMVGWDGTQWVNLGTPTTTGTLSSTGTLSVSGITPNTYTAYTFGAKAPVLVPPTVAITTPATGGTTTTTPTISGTATPNAVVTITGGPGSTGGPVSVTADNAGNYSTSALTFPTGLNAVTAIATNSAGISSPATTSFSVVVPVSPCPNPSVAGTASFTGNPLCSVSNGGTITLTGQTGSVVRWETSTDNGATYTPITNTTTSLPFTNAQNGQLYRAVVLNGAGCTEATTASVTITTSAGACLVACAVEASVITK